MTLDLSRWPYSDDESRNTAVDRSLERCGATDGLGLKDNGDPMGRCNRPMGHDGDWHRETRDGRLWAEWRGPGPNEVCSICHKDGRHH